MPALTAELALTVEQAPNAPSADNRGVAVPTRDELRRIYETTRTIAVVGASHREGRDANRIPRYLQSQGYRVVPVNPRGGTVLGEPVVRSLADIEGQVDVVDVFRPPEEAETIARQAVAIGVPVLWFQPGTHSPAAVRLAEDAGLTVVRELCMGTAHGALGLGPGPPPAPPPGPETEADT